MNQPKLFVFTVFRRWLPLAFLATICAGLVYVTVQQDMRQGANDPQIQMAEDAAAALAAGKSPEEVVHSDNLVLIESSLAPFIAVYDDSGKPIISSGFLHGVQPTPPAGVFDTARARPDYRVTWQPEPSVRQAVVLKHYSGPRPGFVLASRSLREVENREEKLTLQVAGTWVVALVGTLIFSLL